MGRALLALAFSFLLLFSLATAALPAPTVRSTNYPDSSKWYTPALSIELVWDVVEEATSYYYIMDKNPSTAPEIGMENVQSTTAKTVKFKKTDGAWYFHVRAAKGVNLGETAHFKVQLDGTNPDWPSGAPLKAIPTKEGGVKLSWDTATDDLAGIDYYVLYRGAKFDFTIRDLGVRRYSPIAGTGYTDTNNMEQGVTFFYLVAAIDKAGNQSRLSNKASALTFAFCDINVSMNMSLSSDKNKLLVSVTADGNLYSSTLTLTMPDGAKTDFFTNTTFLAYNDEVDLAGKPQGVVKLDLSARERLGDDCSDSKEFTYDVTAPSVEIVAPKLNETVSEEVKVKATAVDNGDYKSGISSVTFFVKTEQWQSMGEMQPDSNGLYSIDWNTFNLDNGRYQLKVIAKDAVGNTVEQSSGAIVLNTKYQQGDANAAIAAAIESRKTAMQFVDSLKKQNVVSGMLDELIAAADGNLSKAKEAYAAGGNKYADAKDFAETAKGTFGSLESLLALVKSDAGSFVYNKEQVAILLNAAPLDKALINDAKQLIEAASPQRKLELVKVVESGRTYFRANIVITFSFSPDFLAQHDFNSLTIMEVVPKEFAANASDIYSAFEFTVLQADPILQFKVGKETITAGKLTYGLKRELSEADANALVSGNVVNKYVAPPILLSGEASLAQGGFSIPFLQVPFELILGIVIAVVVIIAVAVAVLVLKKKKTQKKPDLSVFE